MNAMFPLFFNSVERLYQSRIDAAVRCSIRWVTITFLALFQFVFIVFFAPTILLLGVLERLCPRVLDVKWMKESYAAIHLVLTKRFWPAVSASFNIRRDLKNVDKSRPNKASEATSGSAPGAPPEAPQG